MYIIKSELNNDLVWTMIAVTDIILLKIPPKDIFVGT